jgi:hypothetical protein
VKNMMDDQKNRKETKDSKNMTGDGYIDQDYGKVDRNTNTEKESDL